MEHRGQRHIDLIGFEFVPLSGTVHPGHTDGNGMHEQFPMGKDDPLGLPVVPDV